MKDAAQPPLNILTAHHLSDPQFVVTTPIARVWKVTTRNGENAALKVYLNPEMSNERAGFFVMEALKGRAAAKVIAIGAGFALTEWLAGPSLGDLSRSGKDTDASKELAKVATKMHSDKLTVSHQLQRLKYWFSALQDLDFTPECPGKARQNLQASKSIANKLLDTETDIRPLHGDLHHDNIRLGPRGFAAFDAKGVLGERCFELANAFRNPEGAEELVRDPARIQAMAHEWSQAFGVEANRLLQWATAKCALSISWRSNGPLKTDPEFDLLATLLSQTRL